MSHHKETHESSKADQNWHRCQNPQRRWEPLLRLNSTIQGVNQRCRRSVKSTVHEMKTTLDGLAEQTCWGDTGEPEGWWQTAQNRTDSKDTGGEEHPGPGLLQTVTQWVPGVPKGGREAEKVSRNTGQKSSKLLNYEPPKLNKPQTHAI